MMLEITSKTPLDLKCGPATTEEITGIPASPPRTLNDLLETLVLEFPDTPLVGYPASTSSPGDYVFHTPRTLDEFAQSAANILVAGGLSANCSISDNKVVAILAPSDLDYIVTIFALIRMRCTVLLLSNRLALEAYVNLLDKTNCDNLIVSESMKATAQAVQNKRPVTLFAVPQRTDYEILQQSTLSLPPETEVASARLAFIIHSSGSTGLPKPIFQTHKACLANYKTGTGFRAFLTLPLFHNHGLSTFFRSICTRTPVGLFNASLPLTASNIIAAMEAVKPESFHGVPYALKLLAEEQRGIELLRDCKLVLFGGSSCPDDLGDKLVEAGVYLVSHYGATEMGQLMTSFRPKEDKAWNYVRPFPDVAPFLYFAPRGDNVFEVVVLDGWKSKVTSNSDDPPNSFHTSDLFTPHPTIPNAWKYLSRNDDRITLVNGEKVLPVPFENHLRRNPLVREALLFGVDKTLPGLLIIPSERTGNMSHADLLDAIWPSIFEANAKVESFSQISREMVEILDIHVDYPATDKGTMIRAASYKKFASLIEAVYARFEGTNDSQAPKLQLSQTDLEEYVLKAVEDKANRRLAVDDDFFNAGIDSLQATTIRAFLKRSLDTGENDLGQNIIFEYPNARRLAEHLYALRTGSTQEKESEIDVMQELITKYSTFKKHTPVVREVVLLSGTTGGLGAHILSQLLACPNVEQVYCPVRASSPSAAFDRVLNTLVKKGLSEFSNVHKIIALPADFSKADLGLSTENLAAIRTSLTKVIHSAWAVNFNLGVRSFEQQHIQGVSNLINLCLSVERPEPAQFYFCSSISVAAATPLPATIAEAPIPELAHAQNMGYARSKVVAEKIIQSAAESTGMIAKVLRVGQIVGDSQRGIWNTTEAIPLMIQSAATMGALPALEETPSWMPVDLVAHTILDISGLTATPNLSELHDPNIVYNVQNPHLFHWTHDLLPALRSAGLNFETVSQKEWVRRLRDSDADVVKNPTRKLVDFYADKYDNDKPGRSGLVFRTEKTEAASETMKGGYDIIGNGLVEKMVNEFRSSW